MIMKGDLFEALELGDANYVLKHYFSQWPRVQNLDLKIGIYFHFSQNLSILSFFLFLFKRWPVFTITFI